MTNLKMAVWLGCILYSGLLYGQQEFTLSGYIQEASSSEKLFGVTLVLNGSIGTTTNEYGFYSITLPADNYALEISYLGFQTIRQEITLQGNQKINFELVEETNELDEVVVKSNRVAKAITSTEMSVATLKTETIKKIPAILGEPDLVKSIQLLPGVSSVNEAASGFNVRGGSADQNLVLLDEATLYNSSHLFGFFSVFNSDAIKDVKLYKGGIPAMYGGRLSSVLDVKQREGNAKEFNGLASVGLISAKALVEGPLGKGEAKEGKGSYMIAGRRSYADAFTFLSSEFKDVSAYFYDLNLKANYELNENNKLYLSGYFGRDKFGVKGLVNTFWGNGSGTLRCSSVLSDKLFLQASGIYSNYSYNLDNLRSGAEFRWKSVINNYNFKPRLSWFINGNNTVKVGTDFTYYNFKPGQISPLKGSSVVPQTFQDNFAFETGTYVDYQQKVSEKLSLQYGLRWSTFNRLGKAEVNQYETGNPLTYDSELDNYIVNPVVGTTTYKSGETIKSYTAFEPRFSMRYLLTDNSSVKASYNRMNQYLHLISNTTSATPLDVWAPSGTYLKPQSLDQYALGYFKTFKEGAYDLSLEGYYKNIRDVTDFKNGADLLFTESVETEFVQGNGRAYGLELQVNKNEGKLTGWLSYTLARSESKVLGINNNQYYPTNSDQLHELNLVGIYKLNNRWDFGANFIFGSGRPVTYPTGRYSQNGLVLADYSDRNGNRLPAYHRLDISATLNPKSGKNGKWTFGLVNVYARQNASSIYFSEVSEVNDQEVATGQTQATKLSIFGFPLPSISYEFKF